MSYRRDRLSADQSRLLLSVADRCVVIWVYLQSILTTHDSQDAVMSGEHLSRALCDVEMSPSTPSRSHDTYRNDRNRTQSFVPQEFGRNGRASRGKPSAERLEMYWTLYCTKNPRTRSRVNRSISSFVARDLSICAICEMRCTISKSRICATCKFLN